MDLLKAELKKWHDRNEWYEAIDEVNEKRSRLENMIAWAQIQDYEKKAAAAQVLVDDQKKNLDKASTDLPSDLIMGRCICHPRTIYRHSHLWETLTIRVDKLSMFRLT